MFDGIDVGCDRDRTVREISTKFKVQTNLRLTMRVGSEVGTFDGLEDGLSVGASVMAEVVKMMCSLGVNEGELLDPDGLMVTF